MKRNPPSTLYSFLSFFLVFLFSVVSPDLIFGQCTLGSLTLKVVEAPVAEIIEEVCDPGQNGYHVVFNISGGDPSSYTISSTIQGTLTGPPYVFTSDLIPSGFNYLFTVTDANDCGESVLAGVLVCACTTEAGSMGQTPLSLCEGDTATAVHDGNQVLEADDNLLFVLHDDNGNSLGTIYETNTSPTFAFVPPLVLGQTYYISAMAGDDDGTGGIDLTDPCLSVAAGTPVTWFAPPTGDITEDVAICVGDSATLTFSLAGNAPFDVAYSDGSQQYVLQNINDGHSIFVKPILSTTYTFISLTDSSPASCLSNLDSTVTVTVNEADTLNIVATICEGDSILLGGAMQTEPGIYTDSLSNGAGCDSIVITTLSVNMTETTAVTSTTCDPAMVGVFEEIFTNQSGCDSVVTTTVSLLPADTTLFFGTSCDPAQVGVFEETFSNQLGCDSVVISNIAFSAVDSVYLNDSTCDPTLAGVFVEIFTNQLGCDSLVTTTISLLPSNQINLVNTSCDPSQTGVFTEVLTNQFGCDSTITTTIQLVEADSVFLSDSTCDPSQSGVFVENFTNQNGCDSVVTTTVALLPSDLTELSGTSCDPAQVGVFTEIFSNQFGCDSTVITTIAYSAVDSTFFTATTCDPTQVGIFVETFTNQLGCDSIATTTVELLSSDLTELSTTTCDPTQAGVFTEIFTNQNGCDSTVILAVTLSPSKEIFLTGTTCDPTQVGIFTETLTNQFGCDSVLITEVSLLPSDQTFLTDSTCDPAQVGTFTETLTNQFGCDSVLITEVSLLPSDQTFLTDSTCDPALVGTFTEVLTNQFGCDSIVITNVSLLTPNECNIEVALLGDPIPCGSGDGILTIDLLQGQLPLDYVIFSNTGFNGSGVMTSSPFSINQLPAGHYTLTLSLPNGISTTEEVDIVPATPPVVSIDIIEELACHGDQTAVLSATVMGDFPPYTFQWSNGETTTDLFNLGAGDFEVTVADGYGCEAVSEVSVAEPLGIDLVFTVNNPDCFEEANGAVVAEAAGGVSPYQYSVNGGSFQDNNLFSGLTAGLYQITVQDVNGCAISESFAINAPIPVDVELGDDLSIQLGDNTELQAIVNLPDSLLAAINWSGSATEFECPTCLTQPITPLVTTTYSIAVESVDGCQDYDALTVYVDRERQVYFPNAFSPNGDGVNDVFYLYAKEDAIVSIHSFLIFDRWGESVFETYEFQPNDPTHGWDGMHKGEQMGPAVFVWFAEIEFIDGTVQLFEGDLVLIR